ncbi:MAG TPA: alpha/beta hydrolase [Flavisolibacter sp.]|nr:alpha/beta hydrolase [Flavisolibacter sp.]
MVRLILVGILFLFSFLILLRAPANLLWYVSILVTEFCWIFFLLLCILLFWKFGSASYHLPTTILATITMAIYLLPVLHAFRTGNAVQQQFEAAFGGTLNTAGEHPFNPVKMLTGTGAKKRSHQAYVYDALHGLSLNFYPSVVEGQRPCIVVIHGGSWAAGDNLQLPELNSELAKNGYHVASITYRLAPKHHYPAPVEDVKTALDFLTENATQLAIDTTAFILLGRSAGGQIALSSAYTLNDKRVKAVISFYGPTDMIWGYENPTSPLVLDSRKVMEDYLGGTLQQVPRQYKQSSATETVTSATPPTLLIYGENDPLVSPRHGNRLTKKLDEKGVKYITVYLPWATHGFDYTLNGPGGQISTWSVRQFLAAVTGKP